MRNFRYIPAFIFGCLVAVCTFGFIRVLPGVWAMIPLPVLAIVVMVFFFRLEQVLGAAVGIGLTLDAFGGYPFVTWTLIMLATALISNVVFTRYITDRSLFALLTLGLATSIAFQVISVPATFIANQLDPRSLAFLPGWGTLGRIAGGIGIGLIILWSVFSIYVRMRGRYAAVRL